MTNSQKTGCLYCSKLFQAILLLPANKIGRREQFYRTENEGKDNGSSGHFRCKDKVNLED